MSSPASASRHRSCLAVPGSNQRALAKSKGLVADELVIDLEDAVPPSHKLEARERVVAAISEGGFAAASISVRINAVGSPWQADDLIALAKVPGLDCVVVPKVESATDLSAVDALLGDSSITTQALIETARGLAGLAEIGACSRRLTAMIIGYADLGASLGRSAIDTAPALWLACQEAVLINARANRLRAIDGPWLGTDTGPAFEASATHAAALGFDGKWAIHPSQIDRLNQIFTPAAAEIERAGAILAALAEAARAGRGAAALDGEMIDEATAVSARRILARAGVGEPAGP